jgi:DNA-binding response OmpR family regulator
MSHETILVTDDEPAIQEVVRERLKREGFAVLTAANGQDTLALVEQSHPSLLILDLMLPDMDGFDVLRQLRSGGHDLPVVILTARDDDVDVIVGLELGADDYVRKPFNPRELAARVKTLLRRRAAALALAERVETLEAQLEPPLPEADGAPDAGLCFDHQAGRVWFNGQLLELRPREYDLLRFLAEHQGQLLSRGTLLDRVWGGAEFIDERTIDVHIHRLRQKLGAIDPQHDSIQTERGTGYRFEP